MDTETAKAPEKSPSRPPQPRAGFLVGVGEDACLGDGWHEREIRHPDGTPYRAVDRRATFSLRLVAGKAARLKILLTAPTPLLKSAYRGELFLEGASLGNIRLDSDSWAIRHFLLPAVDKPRLAQFVLESRASFVPADQIAGNRDCRQIACYIGAIFQETRAESR